MKKLIAVGCLGALMMAVAGPAKADDDNVFKGFYGGLTMGYAMDRSHARTSTVFSSSGGYFAASSVTAIGNNGLQHVNPDGLAGGLEAGYNYQSGPLVVGLEADYSLLSMRDSRAITVVYPCCSPSTFTINQAVSTNWTMSVRPRVGVAFGRFMPYVTGGFAATHIKYDELFTDTSFARESANARRDRAGSIVGAGVEAAMGHHLSAKVEYLYSSFAHVGLRSTNLTAFAAHTAFPSNAFTLSDDLHMHVVRAGINFRF